MDGLRGVAVLLVVLDHLGIRRVAGGYVGVDAFFVISGYFIAAGLLAELGSGRFRLARFYERRIRRILPALLVLLIGTLGLGYRYLFPSEFLDLARALGASLFSMSNFYFLATTDYFGDLAAGQPLLHTWSLAVEEQFYLIFPALMMLLRRVAWDHRRSVLTGLALASLAASCIGVLVFRTAAFYLLPTRAWELLAGALLATGMFPRVRSAFIRNATSAAGLALLLGAALVYSGSTPFPGAAALVPCLGAVLIIGAGESGSSWVGRGLSHPAMVFVGLISYSVYLWHWPIIAFQNLTGWLVDHSDPGLRWPTRLAEFLVTFLLAAASWRFVEQPFRHGQLRLEGRRLFGAAAAGVALVAGAAIAVRATNGFRARFRPGAAAVSDYLTARSDEHYRRGSCFITVGNDFGDYRPDLCLRLDPARRNYLLLGDSHAAQLWYGLDRSEDANILQATASGCKPTIAKSVGDAERCRRLVDYVYFDFLKSHRVDKLLLSARWEEPDLDSLGLTLEWARAHGLPVVVFGPIVEYDRPLPRLLAESIVRGDASVAQRHRSGSVEQLDDAMSAVARAHGVSYVSLLRTICSDGSCTQYAAPNVPLQFDYGHLTAEGSLLLARRWQKAGALAP